MENNGLELCADWLEGEIVRRGLNLYYEVEKECIDYMVDNFYDRVDKILKRKK
ncbi:hypothetical protein MWH28_07300 [Natroniella sulfidigena]|uniref:hypothetical protein n=1 Tax=Natroniella sulfidigena TaxID=723921 RepID=UPI00200B9266|nr:hypothetical protein [Natroniella sulfidigena]MCK8817165.1 hypothetical protein [Natroniella sulfidigena]